MSKLCAKFVAQIIIMINISGGILVVVFLILVSCKKTTTDINKSSDKNEAKSTDTAVVTATINGEPVKFIAITDSSKAAFNYLKATGSSSKSIVLTTYGCLSGAYKLGKSADIAYNIGKATYTNSRHDKGAITISTKDGKAINGTFTGTLVNINGKPDTVKITAGTFKNIKVNIK